MAERSTLHKEVAEANFLILAYLFIEVTTDAQDLKDCLWEGNWADFLTNERKLIVCLDALLANLLNERGYQSTRILAGFWRLLNASKYLESFKRVLRETIGSLYTKVSLIELREQTISDSWGQEVFNFASLTVVFATFIQKVCVVKVLNLRHLFNILFQNWSYLLRDSLESRLALVEPVSLSKVVDILNSVSTFKETLLVFLDSFTDIFPRVFVSKEFKKLRGPHDLFQAFEIIAR